MRRSGIKVEDRLLFSIDPLLLAGGTNQSGIYYFIEFLSVTKTKSCLGGNLRPNPV